ncbi:MAG: metalloregulator ArsR/SmtB family transcription factor [candidate division WOR-3 bacterium]
MNMKLTIDSIIDIFKALSDKTRLRIIWILHQARCDLCVCEIIDAVEENQYNVSRHLKILKYAGLVHENKQGRFVYYSLTKLGYRLLTIIGDLFSLISDEILATDAQRLKKRLALRENDKCVIGMHGKRIK